ncbi:uncharacterized protein LOC120575649 [Perca fluviatilis]|uniref:uncharacterized protein LOC120575649 n=1 Tax=Perca fluviatilis TaxID=8168 RepID=UPI001963724A|nr:uncharacterized protein LOC120575649 [Perca fluviatilis]
MFNTDQPRGKRLFSTPAPCIVKKTDFHMYVLSVPGQFTPKASEELELAHAGLGKRMLSIPDHLKHDEIVALLEEEFPELKTLQGGWMFFKSTGGSGRRKLSTIPTDAEGYSTRLLKSASNNGQNMVFVVPLQEKLSTEPLSYDSVEFAKMPQSKCITCGSQMPLQLLPLHVEECNGTLTESESGTCLDEDCSVLEQPVPSTIGMDESLAVCPICLASYPADVLPSYASTCGDRMNCAQPSVAASPPRGEELPGPPVPQSSVQQSSAASTWATEVDPQKACQLFREDLLNCYSESPLLSLSLDMFDAEEEQDSALISFYKQNNVNWAAPFKCRLRGSAASTTLFEGEKEHRVPSAAVILRESNLFEMAGRMMGHSFLHGGFSFSGLSLPVVTLLTGESIDTALTLEDCPDIDHRETIGLVLHRVKQPINEIRKGLKQTGIWPLLSDRPDVHRFIFPRESSEELNPQTVIQNITWPQPNFDSDEDEDDTVPLEKISLVTGFLRKFIEEASPDVLRDLMKFWVGWELPTTKLNLEVVTSTYPAALTCFFKLKLPSHYQTYKIFTRT